MIKSCGQTVFAYAVRRGHFDTINKILDYYGFKSDLTFWMSKYTKEALSVPHPLEVCSGRLLIYLLQLGADPNVGLKQKYKDFMMMSADQQRKSRSRSCFSGAPLNRIIGHRSGERPRRLLSINCLLYYGANPNIPGMKYFSPMYEFIDNYGTNNADILPTVQMMVLCGLDMRSFEYWLIDELLSRDTLGSPAIRQWLLWNVEQPMPLFHCCIVTIRACLGSTAHQTVDSLSLATQLKDYVRLKHIFKPPTVDSNGMFVSDYECAQGNLGESDFNQAQKQFPE